MQESANLNAPRPSARILLPPRVLASRFVTTMREWGFTGWHTDRDIVAFAEWFCDENGFEALPVSMLLAQVAALGEPGGVQRARKRLNDTGEPALRRLRERHERAGGDVKEKLTLYRIAPEMEMAAPAAVVRMPSRRAARPRPDAGSSAARPKLKRAA